MHKTIAKTIKTLTLSLLVGVLLQVSVAASPYGSGNYGACAYSQGCSPATIEPPSPPITPSCDGGLLNSFGEYFTDGGKLLNLGVGQVVCFDIVRANTTEHYTITIKEVGSNYVVITLSSSGGTVEKKLMIGGVLRYDANGDGTDDIQINLLGISDGQASMVFKNLLPKVSELPKESAGTAERASPNRTLLIISLIMLVLGLLLFIILFILRRRRDHDDDQNHTITPTTRPPGQY